MTAPTQRDTLLPQGSAHSKREDFIQPRVSGAAPYCRTVYNKSTGAAQEFGGGMFNKSEEKVKG